MGTIYRFKDYFTDMGLHFDRAGFEYALEIINRSDKEFILSSIQNYLIADQNKCIAIMLGIAVAVLSILIIVCTIAILRSQGKTQKMLRELQAREEQKDKTPKEVD